MKTKITRAYILLLSFTRKWQLPKQMAVLIFTGILLSFGAVNSVDETENPAVLSGTNDIPAQVIQDEPLSEDYDVWINGVKAVVYIARVQDPPWEKTRTNFDHGGNYSFTSFDIRNISKITIRSSKISLENTVIRPDNAGIKGFKNSANEITFTIDKPVKLSIEPDGKIAPLLVFANPLIDYKPAKDDKNVIYFGPGIHRPDSAIVRINDNQTLYLAEGAILKAGVIVSGNNATICGRGIICGNEFVWRQNARNLVLVRGSNVVVRDIILRGGATWIMPVRECNNVIIDNVKILGGRAQNDDGINPVNAQDITIKNCFIRTDDDCIALKGMQKPPFVMNTERITIENSILWCDRANVFRLGCESRAEYLRDVVIRNIDVLHYSPKATGPQTRHPVFYFQPGEEIKMQNIIVENIRINGEGQEDLMIVEPTINQWMITKVPGYINNVTFTNIEVTGKQGAYKIIINGYDQKYTTNGVTLSDIFILGNRLKRDSKHLEIGDYVYNVKIK